MTASILKYSILVICIIWAWCWGCTTPRDEDRLYVENELNSPSIPFEDYFDSLQLTRLEFSTKCIQNEVSKVQWQGNLLFMLDAYRSGSLCVFNKESKSYWSLSTETLFDIYFKETRVVDFEALSDSFVVLTKNPSTLMIYDMDFKLIRTIPLKFRARNFRILPSKDYIFYKTLDTEEGETADFFYHLIRTDPDGNFIEGTEPFTIPLGPRTYMDLSSPLGRHNDLITYTKPFSDTVTVIRNSLSVPNMKFVVDLKHKVLEAPELNNAEIYAKINSDPEQKNPIGISYFILDNEGASLMLSQNHRKTFFIKNFNTHKSQFGLYLKVGNDEGFLPPAFFKQGDTYISILNEDTLSQIPIEKAEGSTYQQLYEEILEKGATYVAFFKLKK